MCEIVSLLSLSSCLKFYFNCVSGTHQSPEGLEVTCSCWACSFLILFLFRLLFDWNFFSPFHLWRCENYSVRITRCCLTWSAPSSPSECILASRHSRESVLGLVVLEPLATTQTLLYECFRVCVFRVFSWHGISSQVPIFMVEL